MLLKYFILQLKFLLKCFDLANHYAPKMTHILQIRILVKILIFNSSYFQNVSNFGNHYAPKQVFILQILSS